MTETEWEELVLTPAERAGTAGIDGVTFVMDWTGEEEPGRLAAFVADRVRALGGDPAGVIDAGAVHHPTAGAGPAPRRGDLPVRQLDRLSGALEEIGYALLTLDSGTDAYEVLVALTGGHEPTGWTHRGVPVRRWGAEREGTLVSLDCPGCADMLVWELPAGRSLADERCDCGTALFDATGLPLPGVTLHD
ncbi:hypothetical protein JNUCC64_00850 [Streptomyces sp. JNUCC 64]